jgi:hypothetical protein
MTFGPSQERRIADRRAAGQIVPKQWLPAAGGESHHDSRKLSAAVHQHSDCHKELVLAAPEPNPRKLMRQFLFPLLGRFAVLILLAVADLGWANEPPRELLDRQAAKIDKLELTLAALQSEIDALKSSWHEEPGSLAASSGVVPKACVPSATGAAAPFSHVVIYDNGWTLRPVDSESTPYELKFSLHNQFRYTGFATDDRFYVNSAERSVPTPSRNDFDINRGRLVFSGYAIDPRLEFYANIDYNTVADQQIQMLMAWIRLPLGPALNIAYGLGKVPGTWEWLESSRYTLGSERSLATTFCRPSMTAGIWSDGELLPGWHYHALIGDGFNTFSLNAAEVDTNLAYSGML